MPEKNYRENQNRDRFLKKQTLNVCERLFFNTINLLEDLGF